MIGPHPIVRSVAAGVADLVFPPVCAFCEAELRDEAAAARRLCAGCREAFVEPQTTRCRKCAARVALTMRDDADCPWCRDHQLRFDRTFALGTYHEQLREAALLLKRRGTEAPVHALAGELWDRYGAEITAEGIDVVVPVPMHWWRRMRRGWNAPELTAALSAVRLKVRDYPRLLVRRRATRPQSGLTATERRENVRRAFAVRLGYQVRGANVLLVDDILTTGATCSEAAATLKRAGAAKVIIAVFARAQGETK